MSTSKERQNAIKRLRSFLFSSKIDIKEFREKIDKEFYEVYMPNGVELEEKKYGNVPCDILRPEMYSKKRLMIYIHGGAFIAGSRKSYRSFVSSLANACSCVAVVPEFRLSPSHPFPFSVNDVQDVFTGIYNEYSSQLYDLDEFETNLPEIILAADSSGASIALGFMLNLKPSFRKSISRIVLLSPWLDVSEDNPKLCMKKGGDEVFTSESVRLCVESYATVEKRNTPLVSPSLARPDEFKNFPPVYIQCGEKEMFLEECIEFDRLLTKGGINCMLDVWKDMMPLFQLVDDCLSESHIAVEKIGKIIVNHIIEAHEPLEESEK
ncbi:MAG: alpha/beta hydrolase fold domain-containing protein [Treponema sp.]|nr:alpha/beta hydrolase fold domain-containing protein [Treponema sp.]